MPPIRERSVAIVKHSSSATENSSSQPAAQINGCAAGLCVIGLHAPHGDITNAHVATKVQSVCGDAAESCVVVSYDVPDTSTRKLNERKVLPYDFFLVWLVCVYRYLRTLIALSILPIH